jgi:predicted GNAT family acetyltransferase
MSAHKPSNFERMIALAEQVFDVRNDPDQLDVDQDVLSKLESLHPASVSEEDNGEGPVAWVLLVPTTCALMEAFLKGEISERELFLRTEQGLSYDALYLCSALVLDEFRKRGIASRLTHTAIQSIAKDHPINKLFVWPFSKEGLELAQKLSEETDIPLAVKK